MGFFDFIASLFGGGAKIALDLDGERIPVGGFLSGKAIVTGAPKDCVADVVKVQLVYVRTEQKEDSVLPEIDMRVLVDQVIANNVALAANEEKTIDFTLTVPGGTEPTAHNVAYQAKATADIKGLKDPSAVVKLEVYEGEGEGAGLTAEGLYGRWPALRGTETEPLVDALSDMRWKHDEDEAENDLRVAEPILIKLINDHPEERVRTGAFETWVNIVSDSLRTEHISIMRDALDRAKGNNDGTLVIIRAMGPSMYLGGDALVSPYLDDTDAGIRRAAKCEA